MRTLIIIAIGIAVALLVLRFIRPSWRLPAAAIFSGLWLLASAWNLRIGMSHGYTLQQELPIHLLIWSVPVGVALWLALKRGRH